jgi:uncharacterized protein YaiL (DUF2058 family)
MKVYQTNASLGYNQLAYLIRLDSENYLCIDTENVSDGTYEIGEKVSQLDDFYLEETNYKIEQSPIYNSFLFQEFIKKIKMEKLELSQCSCGNIKLATNNKCDLCSEELSEHAKRQTKFYEKIEQLRSRVFHNR